MRLKKTLTYKYHKWWLSVLLENNFHFQQIIFIKYYLFNYLLYIAAHIRGWLLLSYWYAQAPRMLGIPASYIFLPFKSLSFSPHIIISHHNSKLVETQMDFHYLWDTMWIALLILFNNPIILCCITATVAWLNKYHIANLPAVLIYIIKWKQDRSKHQSTLVQFYLSDRYGYVKKLLTLANTDADVLCIFGINWGEINSPLIPTSYPDLTNGLPG